MEKKQDLTLSTNIAIREMISTHLGIVGLKMSKRISSGSFFFRPTVDTRIVYSYEQLYKLLKEGFGVSEDIGMFIFNAINRYEKHKK